MKTLLSKLKSKVGIAIVAVVLVAVITAVVIAMMPGEDGEEGSDGAGQTSERSQSQLSAEMDILRGGVEENRAGTNDAANAINDINLVLDGQAEQVAALLQKQQTVNPAVLEVQIEQLAATVEEISLILGQTRRQTQEITEIGGAVSTLQRRLQALQTEVEANTTHTDALAQRITETQRVAETNAELLADPTIFQRPEVTVDWDKIGAPEALGLCRNSQLWAHKPPSTPGQTFSLDMSTQIAMYYRNEMNEGRMTEAQARDLLKKCQEDLETSGTAAN